MAHYREKGAATTVEKAVRFGTVHCLAPAVDRCGAEIRCAAAQIHVPVAGRTGVEIRCATAQFRALAADRSGAGLHHAMEFRYDLAAGLNAANRRFRAKGCCGLPSNGLRRSNASWERGFARPFDNRLRVAGCRGE
jgi:hypothetical protein